MRRSVGVLAVAAVVLAMMAGCTRVNRGASVATDQGPAAEVRLGYFPNITHAPALIALDQGYFGRQLGSTKLTPAVFNAGPDAVAALLGGSLDVAFIGSGPAINAFAKAGSDTVRVVAGVTSGGAQLVVRPDITGPPDLRGRTVADPEAGNTQDVALKKWIAAEGLSGVNVQNSQNSTTLQEFRQGALAGAWVPEPWSSRLVIEAGAKVLVDEKNLWPDGRFPATVLLVRTRFLQQHPQTVQAILRATLAADTFAATDPAGAKAAVNRQLKALTGAALSPAVLDRAFGDIELTTDPLASRFPQLARDEVTAGVAKTVPSPNGLFDLTALNTVLSQAGAPAVSADGADK